MLPKSKLIFLQIFLFFCLTRFSHSLFLPERLLVIDSANNNFIVRGNLPINDQRQFQIKELKTNLSSLTGLKKYRLVVISFLNFLTAKETRNRYIEEKFF